MVNRGSRFTPIELSDADVVMVVGGSKDGSGFFLKFLFTRVNKNFRALLNFGLFGVFRHDVFKTADCFFEFLVVVLHQFDSRFIGLHRTCKCLDRTAGGDVARIEERQKFFWTLTFQYVLSSAQLRAPAPNLPVAG